MKESEIMVDRFALNMRSIRHQRDLTLKDVALKTGLAVYKITAIEKGEKKLWLCDAIDICKGLEVDLMQMLREDIHDPGRYA